MALPVSSAGNIQEKKNNLEQKIFENSEYVTTNGAAKFLSQLLGKNITANAIRLRVFRKQLIPIKPFGQDGGSYFRISELRQRFTHSQRKVR